MCIVSVGTAFDGLTLYGPFDSTNEAVEWAKNHLQGETWEVVLLNDPES